MTLRRLFWGIAGTLFVSATGASIFATYWFDWSGTGIPGRTVWDWMQLLTLPVVFALIALRFSRTLTRSEHQLAQQRSRDEHQLAQQRFQDEQQLARQRFEDEQQLALDRQRADVFQTYLDRMSELLLHERLRSSTADAEVRHVARVRTITVLSQLDARRIGAVFAFLREARLMSLHPDGSIVSLQQADFSRLDLSQADLFEANLSAVNLCQANLSAVNLSAANLSAAFLRQADLSFAELSEANLSAADLTGADLSQARLNRADLRGANLSAANLYKADVSGADLSGANLTNTNLSGADLGGANLTGTRLDDTLLTPEQIERITLSQTT